MSPEARRVVCWWSHGAASTIATKMILAEYGHDDVVIACIDTGSEDDDDYPELKVDRERFRLDCERWFHHPIVMLQSDKYKSVDEVIEKRRYLNGPVGALCTVELKKKVRWAFQEPNDLHVMGYTADKLDRARADRLRLSEPELYDFRAPLIERDLTKSHVLAMVERAGITLPLAYLRGYRNNNCLGCVKGGMGYWNKQRVDYPKVFARRARQEREIGHTCLTEDDGTPVYLDELDPTRGNYAAESAEGCSFDCAIVESEWSA